MTDLRQTMVHGLQRFAKAVSIITTEHAGQRIAMTATAVCEVSLDPPTLLVCINDTASISRLIRDADSFTVNILSADQQDVADACAGKLSGEDRFTVGRWIRHDRGNWVLDGAQASFLCTHAHRVPAGSHTVFVGRVNTVIVNDTVQPLVYVNRRYIALQPDELA